MSLPDFLPKISCDVELGKMYDNVDINIAGIAEYLQKNGLDDEAIGKTSISFSSQSIDIALQGEKSDPVGGFYHRDLKVVACLLGTLEEGIDRIIEDVEVTGPMRPLAEALLRHSSSRLASETLLHELNHRIEDNNGLLEPPEDVVSPLSTRIETINDSKKIKSWVKKATYVSLGIAGLAAGEAFTEFLKPVYPFVIGLGSAAVGVMVGVRNLAFSALNRLENRYRQERQRYDTAPHEQRANENISEVVNDFYEKYGKLPVSLQRKKAA